VNAETACLKARLSVSTLSIKNQQVTVAHQKKARLGQPTAMTRRGPWAAGSDAGTIDRRSRTGTASLTIEEGIALLNFF
jgi:hypothetical protein